MQKNILLYDGECYLCNGFVNRVLKLDLKQALYFSPYQSNFGKQLVHDYAIKAPETGVVLVFNGKVYTQSDAVIKTGIVLGFPHNLIALGYMVPSFIRNWGYGIVAKNRYKWFGKSASCILPLPKVKDRFLLESK